jgi:hypothetical protein
VETTRGGQLVASRAWEGKRRPGKEGETETAEMEGEGGGVAQMEGEEGAGQVAAETPERRREIPGRDWSGYAGG